MPEASIVVRHGQLLIHCNDVAQMLDILKRLTTQAKDVDAASLSVTHKDLVKVASLYYEDKKIRSIRDILLHARGVPHPLKRQLEAANVANGLLRHVPMSELERFPQLVGEWLRGDRSNDDVDRLARKTGSACEDSCEAERDATSDASDPQVVNPPLAAAPSGGSRHDPLAGLCDNRILCRRTPAAISPTPTIAQESTASPPPVGEAAGITDLHGRMAALERHIDSLMTDHVEAMRAERVVSDKRQRIYEERLVQHECPTVDKLNDMSVCMQNTALWGAAWPAVTPLRILSLARFFFIGRRWLCRW